MNDIDVKLPPNWERDAVPGNKPGNARAFGIAAALLKARAPLPDELADWLAVRLASLHDALRDSSDTRMHSVASALRLTGRVGNKARSSAELAMAKQLAWEVYYEARFRGTPGRLPASATLDDIFAFVANRRNAALDALGKAGRKTTGLRVTEATVEAAWRRRHELDDFIPELNPAT